MSKRDLLCLADLSAKEILSLIAQAVKFKRQVPSARQRMPLGGKVLGLLFEKASTRTRTSFEAGMYHLGGHSIFLAREDLQIHRGETLEDTAKAFSLYLDGLVIRTYGHQTLEQWAHFASIPVINGLSDLHHPCQGLGDLMTLQEHFGLLKGLKIAFLGDGDNNVAHSLIEGAAMVGVHVSLACPPGFRPNAAIVRAARAQARHTGSRVEIMQDPIKVVSGADALYTDVWVSMGKEEETRRRLKLFKPYQVNAALLKKARSHAVVMHCLPAHRGEEITAQVLDGPSSIVWEQAENRLHIQKAILQKFLGKTA